jgi:hypothetical protein
MYTWVMSEGIPTHSEKEPTKNERIIALALELHERNEIFPFTGIVPESYEQRKMSDQEYPEYSTPIDELIERFKNEGMKVVLGKNPQSGNVYILPAGSTDLEMDNVLPAQLQINENMGEKLKELILLTQG